MEKSEVCCISNDGLPLVEMRSEAMDVGPFAESNTFNPDMDALHNQWFLRRLIRRFELRLTTQVSGSIRKEKNRTIYCPEHFKYKSIH
jgi:hypothetical protein